MTYARNHKGMTLVLMSFLLVLLLIFASLAIDIAYMYLAKNQLQVAADAAALAGVTELYDANGNPTFDLAKITAKDFALKNSAAGSSVVLALDGSNTLRPSNDVTVGNWNPVGFPAEPYSEVRTPVNAVKVMARRTANSPGGPVGIILGRVFGWSLMSASASAIAYMPPRATSFIALGNNTCDYTPDCPDVPLTGCAYPTICPIVPARVLTANTGGPGSPSTGGSGCHHFGWTSLLLKPGNSDLFGELMCGNSPFQDVCPPIPGIWGINGTTTVTLRKYESLMFDPTFDAANKEKDGSGNVIGWWIMVPQDETDPDPMTGPDTQRVMGYILIRIVAVCAPGGGGGSLCTGRPYSAPSSLCSLYPFPAGSGGIVIDRISCIGCDTVAPGLKPALVR
jgi:Flp pilus assembly protein TadG